MLDYYSGTANFVKNIESKGEGEGESKAEQDTEMITKKKALKEREGNINRAKFTVFNIFNFLDFEEEDDVNRPKYMIFDIFDFLDFKEEGNTDNKINMNNIGTDKINSCAIQKKKQEMINKAEIYVNAFKQMLRDFKNKDFSDNSEDKTMNKAERYVNTFEHMLKDFKNKDFSDDSSDMNN